MEFRGNFEYDHFNGWEARTFEGFYAILKKIGLPSVEHDPALPFDRDGSKNEQGQLVYFRDITLAGSSFAGSAVPSTLYEAGVRKIKLFYTPRRVVEDDVFQEAIDITVLDETGLKKEWQLQHEHDGTFTTKTDIGFETQTASGRFSKLTEEERAEILEAVFSGDVTLLSRNDIYGEYARMVQLELCKIQVLLMKKKRF